jgi:putative oxidoreductase
MKPQDVICLLASIGSKLQPVVRDIVLLFARITIGWSFFITGKGKLANLERTTGFFESLGIPAPGFHAYLVGGVEMVGGILLVVGLLSRAAAAPLAVAMIVAYLTAHREEAFQGISEFTGESPFAFLLVSLVILAFGPGRVALDAPVKRLLCKEFDHG